MMIMVTRSIKFHYLISILQNKSDNVDNKYNTNYLSIENYYPKQSNKVWGENNLFFS